MRLASFSAAGTERWGPVVTAPTDGADWILEPDRAERALASMASVRTSGYFARRSSFGTSGWPSTLAGFLGEGESAMARLTALYDVIARFIEQSDQTLLARSGYPVANVELLAPIPHPRLVWGLVTNSPSFVRNDPHTPIVNLFPLAHQRPQGSVVGAGQPIVMKNGHERPWFAYNVELGIVIGTGGRYIPLERAMDHVAGYTVVNDVSGSYYFRAANRSEDPSYRLPERYGDWFAQATASWAGKMADTMCPIGPYLVTKEEVGDPYDLLVYTRQSGLLRDRSHTAGTLLGIERVIEWYSSFATLHPGDIIHFGTMGVDGLRVEPGAQPSEDEHLEVEIESVGVLRNPLQIVDAGSDRAPSVPYAVRSLREQGHDSIEISEWTVSSARHFYTAFGNTAAEGLAELETPRFLNGPASSLCMGSAPVHLPPRTADIVASVELCLVVGKIASDVSVEDAFDYILGFAPMIGLTDTSFRSDVVEPARPGERTIPEVYGRWADGFNAVGPLNPVGRDEWSGLRMTIRSRDDVRESSTSDYIAGPAEMLASVSAMITLFPGDVITLGATAGVLDLPEQSTDGRTVVARIDGLGTTELTMKRPGKPPS